MNMKSILFAASAALAVSLQAEVTANNTLCRIEVSSAAKSIIVAVPLVAVQSGDNIKVTDYIMTTNLKQGDSILKWNGTAWEGWAINSEGKWEAVISVAGYSDVSTTAPAADSALARGAAVWLNRSSNTISSSSSFYLYGQVASGSVTLTAEAGKYTLLGNPTTAALDLSKLSWSDCSEKDQIIFASESSTPRTYTYRKPTSGDSATWCKKVVTTSSDGLSSTTYTALTENEVTLAPGVGFWYNSKGSASPSVTIGE